MPATRCTCVRNGLTLEVMDPACKAPSHLRDMIDALEEGAWAAL